LTAWIGGEAVKEENSTFRKYSPDPIGSRVVDTRTPMSMSLLIMKVVI